MPKNTRFAKKVGKVPKMRQLHKSVKRRKPKQLSTLHKREDAEFKIARRKIEKGATLGMQTIAELIFGMKKKFPK